MARSLVRLTQAFTILLLLQAVIGITATPGAQNTFPTVTPQLSNGFSTKECGITSSPVVFNGSQVLNSYNCGIPAAGNHISYVGLYSNSGSHQYLRSNTKANWAPPIAVGNTLNILAYTAGSTNFEFSRIKMAADGSSHSVHSEHGTGYPMSKPSYSVDHNQAFLAISGSVKALHLDSSAVLWQHNYTGIAHISNVVFLHGLTQNSYVYYLTESTRTSGAPSTKGAPYINKALVWHPPASMSSPTAAELSRVEQEKARGAKEIAELQDKDELADANADIGPAKTPGTLQVALNPCDVTAAPNEHFQLESITFGQDANGPLRGMFMFGNYMPKNGSKFKAPNFVVCRFSHHTLKYSHSWGFNDAYEFFSVSGGDNATFFNVFNKDTNAYEIIVLNQTSQSKYARTHITTRSATDRYNTPVVLYGSSNFSRAQPASPRVVFQESAKANNGVEVVAYDTWHGFSKVTWWNNKFSCYNTPVVQTDIMGQEEAFCNDNHQATAFDYNGTVIWAQQGSYMTMTNPTAYGQNTVLFQGAFSLLGYDLLPAPPAVPGPKDSGTAGRVVLAIFLILLFGAIFAGVGYYVWKNNLLAPAKREAIPESSGLNNDGGYGSVSVAEDTEKV